MTATRAKTPIVIRFNDRNYHPGVWEAWHRSSVIGYSQSLDLLLAKYPDADVIGRIESEL